MGLAIEEANSVQVAASFHVQRNNDCTAREQRPPASSYDSALGKLRRPQEGGQLGLWQDAEGVLVLVARNSLAASLPPPDRAGRRGVCVRGREAGHGFQGPQPPPIHAARAAGRAA